MMNPKSQPVVIRTPDYRLRVFVSSTLKELAQEREVVREAILRLRLAPVMFELGARPHPADELYQAYLAQSHIFIGIYWQSYGWIAPDKQISGLEDEYNLSAGLPRLLYIKSPALDRDSELTGLLERIRNENVGCYKSFSAPEELRELVENDLALLLTERFEATRSEGLRDDTAQHPLTNVPFPRNPLVGREQELRSGCDLLLRDDVALLTLTGPGGSGKSRLGIQIALELRDRFADGVYLVGLEVITEPELVIPTIAMTLGVTEKAGGHTLVGSLKAFLYKKQILLLLDNFEHVLKAAPKIADLLEACPRMKMLVTSRAPLHLRAEKELPVPPLALPPLKQMPDLLPISQYSAVQLFIQRARAVKPDFRVTNENAPAVAEICHRLDGLPLAIELASARIRMLSPQALLGRLERSIEVLRGGTRDLPERQQTLQSAIDWSYNLLTEDDKRLLRCLSVFVGGWSFEAADAVSNGRGGIQIEVFDGLERLIELNLITPSEELNGEQRLKMLETIREFSMQHLIESGEIDHVRRHHAHFYLALAKQAEPELRASDQMQWISRLDTEYGNLRAVLEWSKQHDVELGLELCGAIWRYWEMHNSISEGRMWLEAFISLSPQATAAHGKVLVSAAACAVYQGDFIAAHTHVEDALSIFQNMRDKNGIARALNELGLIASYQGDYSAGKKFLEQSLEIKRELGDQWSIANSINNLGLIAGYQSDYTTAYTMHQESLAIYQALDDPGGVAIATGNLGHVAMHLGRLDEARQWQTESVRLFSEIPDKDGLAECFERLAMLANANAIFKHAAQLFGAASVLRKEAGTLPGLADQLEYQRELNVTREHLDTATFDAAWAEGQGMPLEKMIDLAVSQI